MKSLIEEAENLVHLNMIMKADCPIKIENPKAHDWLVNFLVEFAEKQKNCNIHDVSSRLSSADQEELEKCKNSPVYFYNKYVRKEGQKELTEQEYNAFVKQVEYHRNVPLKLRKHYKDRPLPPSECFNKDGSTNGC